MLSRSIDICNESETPHNEPELLCSCCCNSPAPTLAVLTRRATTAQESQHEDIKKNTELKKKPEPEMKKAHIATEPYTHNPWENIFPDCEFEDDILSIRPNLILWHKVPDKIRLFEQHQRNDPVLGPLLRRCKEEKCNEQCKGCNHDEKCTHFRWKLSEDGLLLRHKQGNPLPRRKEAVETFMKLKTPCQCSGPDKNCIHNFYRKGSLRKKKQDGHTITEAQSFACDIVDASPDNADFADVDIYPITWILSVPKSLITSVLYHIHGSGVAGHPGMTKSYARAKSKFWWKGMREDIRRWVNACLRCQQRKPPRPLNVNTPGTTSLPTGPMQELYIDFSGPFQETPRKNKWILTIICAFSRYPIAVPLPNRTAALVVQTLLEHVIQHYACPKLIISDAAREFIGDEITDFCRVFDIQKRTNPAYSPELSSYVERYHAWQNACITIMGDRYKDAWDLVLPLISLSYRTTIQSSTGMTPFEALRGYEPKMPYDIWDEWSQNGPIEKDALSLPNRMKDIYRKIREAHDTAVTKNLEKRKKKHREHNFAPGDLVLRFAPKTSEVLPDELLSKAKHLDQWSLPGTVVAHGEKGILIVKDEKGNYMTSDLTYYNTSSSLKTAYLQYQLAKTSQNKKGRQ